LRQDEKTELNAPFQYKPNARCLHSNQLQTPFAEEFTFSDGLNCNHDASEIGDWGWGMRIGRLTTLLRQMQGALHER
jgi:hypothetical protein